MHFFLKEGKTKIFPINGDYIDVDAVMLCVCSSSYLSGDTDFRVFSLGFVNYVDSIDENVLQAAPEIWG